MKTVFLGDISKIIAGQSPPSTTYNKNGEGLPFFQGKADFGELYPKTRIWCSKPQKIAEENDILISVRAPVGPTNICSQRACIGRGLSAIRAGEKADGKYLLYFLRKHEQKLASQGNGSTFSAITQEDIKRIRVPLPPLEDQKRIVTILDEAGALRQKRKQAMELIDHYLKSVFANLTKKEKSEKIYFLDLFNIKTGKLDANAAEKNGIYPFYTCSRDDNFKINTYAFDCEALILSGNNANAEYSIKHYHGKFNAYQRTYILTLKKKYSYLFFKMALENKLKLLKKSSIGSNTKYLTMGIFKRIDFEVPNLESQMIFDNLAKKTESLKQKMFTQSEELENQFQALMQKAFKGEL
jgi:type I restriction enzyme S subunit